MTGKQRLINGFFATLVLVLLGNLPANTAESPVAPEKKAEEKPPFDTPLIRYDGLEFSLGYFFYYTRAADDLLRGINQAEDEQRKKMMDYAINETIFEHQMAKDAEANGFQNEKEYTTHMRDMENDWLTRLYTYHQFSKNYTPDEEQLKKLYEEKKKDFFEKEDYSFRHIFLQTVDRTPDQQKQAHEKAEAALALIKAGSDFSDVAKAYSESERQGTLIGPINPAKYNPEKPLNPVIENKLLSMNPGDVSEIVETKYGLEILKLEEHNLEHETPYEKVKNKLVQEQRSKDFEQWSHSLVDSHWDEAVTDYNPDLMFQEKPDPKAILFTVYGQKFDMEDYDMLKGRAAEKQEKESDEEYHNRRNDFLKYTIVMRYTAAKLARDLHYDQIPYYQIWTRALGTNRTYRSWLGRLWDQYQKDHPETEDGLKKYYEENKERFRDRQQAHIGEMTFNLPPHNKEVLYEVHKAQQETEAKAQKALDRVKAGENFAQVAKEVSESETAKNGGDLGLIDMTTDKLPRTVASQAVQLASGTLCEKPIINEDRYYILISYEKPEPAVLPYNNANIQQQVKRGLENQTRGEFMKQLQDKFVNKDKIEVLYKDIYTYNPMNLEQPSLDPPGEKPKEETPEKK